MSKGSWSTFFYRTATTFFSSKDLVFQDLSVVHAAIHILKMAMKTEAVGIFVEFESKVNFEETCSTVFDNMWRFSKVNK